MNGVLLLAMLAHAPPYTGAGLDTHAQRLVKNAIERDAKTTYTCIREWTEWGESETVRVRRDQAANGANKVLVLAPIPKQGFAIIDDGQKRVSYNPDRKELTIQDSPLLTQGHNDADRRYRLLLQNYTITQEAEVKLAGRKAARVKLAPRATKYLYTRRYWIDNSKYVLLRVEWADPDGEKQVLSDTLSIEFPKSLPSDVFEQRFVGRPKEIRIRAPVKQPSLASLAKAVDFAPINPVSLPYGFLFIGADAITRPRRTMAALRYTDGAANITVYQVEAKSGNPPWHGQKGFASVKVDNVWVGIDGDVPAEGKGSILASFRKSGKERSARLAAGAAAEFNIAATVVETLRIKGLTIDQTVACLVASKGKESSAKKAAAIILDGNSMANLAREMSVKQVEIEKGLKRFWDRRG